MEFTVLIQNAVFRFAVSFTTSMVTLLIIRSFLSSVASRNKDVAEVFEHFPLRKISAVIILSSFIAAMTVFFYQPTVVSRITPTVIPDSSGTLHSMKAVKPEPLVSSKSLEQYKKETEQQLEQPPIKWNGSGN